MQGILNKLHLTNHFLKAGLFVKINLLKIPKASFISQILHGRMDVCLKLAQSTRKVKRFKRKFGRVKGAQK